MSLSARVLALSISLFLLPRVYGATVKTPVKATACPVTELDYDDSVDVKAMENYVFAIGALLRHEKFQEIDCIADFARANQTKFASGIWKVHKLYGGLSDPPYHATELDWQNHIALLKKWVAQRPQSITARVGLASAYLGYAWDARGNDWGNSVSDSGWQLFEQRLALAKTTLDEASALKAKCPDWYVIMEMVGQGQGWGRERMLELFQKAIATNPGYDASYVYYANYLLPKWYGEEGEVQAFAQAQADRVGGEEGDRLYFRIAAFLLCPCPDSQAKGMSWERIQKGFIATENRFGQSLTNENKYALMAVDAGDALTAEEMFNRIGEQWEKSTWSNEDYFRSSREHNKLLADRDRELKEIDGAAAANEQTPEGQQYRAKVLEASLKIVKGCIGSGINDQTTFSLKIQFKATGKAEAISFHTRTPLMMCLLTGLKANVDNDITTFPPAPRDDYWIDVTVDPATLTAATN